MKFILLFCTLFLYTNPALAADSELTGEQAAVRSPAIPQISALPEDPEQQTPITTDGEQPEVKTELEKQESEKITAIEGPYKSQDTLNDQAKEEEERCTCKKCGICCLYVTCAPVILIGYCLGKTLCCLCQAALGADFD